MWPPLLRFWKNNWINITELTIFNNHKVKNTWEKNIHQTLCLYNKYILHPSHINSKWCRTDCATVARELGLWPQDLRLNSQDQLGKFAVRELLTFSETTLSSELRGQNRAKLNRADVLMHHIQVLAFSREGKTSYIWIIVSKATLSSSEAWAENTDHLSKCSCGCRDPDIDLLFPIRHCLRCLEMILSHVRNLWLTSAVFPRPLGPVGPLERWSSGLSVFVPWGETEMKRNLKKLFSFSYEFMLRLWGCGELPNTLSFPQHLKGKHFYKLLGFHPGIMQKMYILIICLVIAVAVVIVVLTLM